MADSVDEAVGNGIYKNGLGKIWNLLHKYLDIFCPKLGSGPPADVPPMNIIIKDGARPIKVRLSRYAQKSREFITNFIDKLVETGFLIEHPSATWQAAPLRVLKPGSTGKYRLVIDLKPVNTSTIKEQWPLPHIEYKLEDFTEDKFFCTP